MEDDLKGNNNRVEKRNEAVVTIAFIAICLETTLQTYMLFFAAANFIYIRYSF